MVVMCQSYESVMLTALPSSSSAPSSCRAAARPKVETKGSTQKKPPPGESSSRSAIMPRCWKSSSSPGEGCAP